MLMPYRIMWNGYSSLDFDVYTQFAFDGDNGEIETFLGRDAVVSETYNNAIRKGTNYRWNSEYAPTITFIKQNFEPFSQEQNRRILSWLTGKQTPSYLTLFRDDTDVIAAEILGNWTTVNQYKMGGDVVIGYTATFTSLMPYAMSDIKTKVVDVTMPQVFDIMCLTDEKESFVYPKITIVQNNGLIVDADAELGSVFENNKTAPANYVAGTVYRYNDMFWWVGSDGKMVGSYGNSSNINTTSVVIENLTLGTRTVIGGNSSHETVVVDGANRVMSSDRPTGRVFGNSFNWQWMPLAYGENQIKVVGNCNIRFDFRYPLKIGDYIGTESTGRG